MGGKRRIFGGLTRPACASANRRFPPRLLAVVTICASGVVFDASAQSADADQEARFSIHGSNTIGADLMPALIGGFAQSQGLTLVRETDPSTEDRERLRGLFGLQRIFDIELSRRGSSTSFEALLDGSAAIGMSSRPIRDREAAELSDVGAGDMRARGNEHVVALDGVAIVVSPSNPLNALSLDELARVFSGEITNWRELGLPPGEIRLHARNDASGTLETFRSLALAPTDRALAETAVRHGANQDLARAVLSDPQAIGFASLAAVGAAKTLSIALSCGIVIRPDVFTVKSEEYPLARRLYLYTRRTLNQRLAAALVAYAASDAAQPIIADTGFVDQTVIPEPSGSLSDRLINGMREAGSDEVKEAMRRFIAGTRGGTRLSPTFRFQQGEDLLDGKAETDAARLALWLETPENADARILLAGFSDASGGFDANVALTRQRAEAVRRAILVQVSADFDASRISIDGFGPAAPIACDGDPGGAEANRRVEVWRTP